jgi:hypothetical protein
MTENDEILAAVRDDEVPPACCTHVPCFMHVLGLSHSALPSVAAVRDDEVSPELRARVPRLPLRAGVPAVGAPGAGLAGAWGGPGRGSWRR